MGEFVSDIGERGVVEVFHRVFGEMPGVPVPFGDDVSALRCLGELVVVKCDMLVGETDIPRGMSFRQAGRKAVVSTVSDFASKGVPPVALMASIGLPRGFRLTDLEELAEGLNEGAREYSCYFIGGDTNETDDVIVDCVGLGFAGRGGLMLRGGARPGDVLATTGVFGEAPAGIRMLTEGVELPPEITRRLEEAVYHPRAQLREGLVMAETGGVTSSIDSSDGLSWSLYELSRLSRVGFILSHIPVGGAARILAEKVGLDPLDLALHGGEEYNLVFTVEGSRWHEVEEAVRRIGGEVYKLGEVTGAEGIWVEVEGKRGMVKPSGWEHLRRGR